MPNTPMSNPAAQQGKIRAGRGTYGEGNRGGWNRGGKEERGFALSGLGVESAGSIVTVKPSAAGGLRQFSEAFELAGDSVE